MKRITLIILISLTTYGTGFSINKFFVNNLDSNTVNLSQTDTADVYSNDSIYYKYYNPNTGSWINWIFYPTNRWGFGKVLGGVVQPVTSSSVSIMPCNLTNPYLLNNTVYKFCFSQIYYSGGPTEIRDYCFIRMHTFPRPITTSTNELNKVDISIYPNPTTNYITIQKFINQDIRFTILDVLGQTVSNGILKEDKTPISVSEFPLGTYFLKLENGTSYKIIKK